MGNLGKWLFLAGLVICIVVGLGLTDKQWVPAVLAVLGVVVGILNVGAGESSRFLLAAIGLIICAS